MRLLRVLTDRTRSQPIAEKHTCHTLRSRLSQFDVGSPSMGLPAHVISLFITDWNACFVLRSLACISSCSRLARRLVVLGLWYVQHIKCICFHVHFRSWSISGWSRCFYGILFSLRCHESAYVDVSKVHGFDECFSVSSSWNSSLPCASFWCCISATVKDATISISNLTKVGSSNSGGNYKWFNRSATSKSHNISTT